MTNPLKGDPGRAFWWFVIFFITSAAVILTFGVFA